MLSSNDVILNASVKLYYLTTQFKDNFKGLLSATNIRVIAIKGPQFSTPEPKSHQVSLKYTHAPASGVRRRRLSS